MKNIYATLVALLFLFITACASPLVKDIEVDAEADPKANLAGRGLAAARPGSTGSPRAGCWWDS